MHKATLIGSYTIAIINALVNGVHKLQIKVVIYAHMHWVVIVRISEYEWYHSIVFPIIYQEMNATIFALLSLVILVIISLRY